MWTTAPGHVSMSEMTFMNPPCRWSHRRTLASRTPPWKSGEHKAYAVAGLSNPSIGEASDRGLEELVPQEGQQLGVDLILMGGRHPVRSTRVIDLPCVLDEPGGLFGRVVDRD